MKRTGIKIGSFFLLLTTLFADRPVVSRAMLAERERTLDRRFVGEVLDDNGYLLLGGTRGIYLEGYGVVFSLELNLVAGPAITPFRQQISEEEIKRVHQRKLDRLPQLRKTMRGALVATANALSAVPPEENVVMAVSLLNLGWEDTKGLPSQIVMKAQRKTLLEKAPAETSIVVKEY